MTFVEEDIVSCSKQQIHDKANRYFHVTPMENVESILQNGLIPQIGALSDECGETQPAVYLFASVDDMKNALLNWLGEAFIEDLEVDDLAIIQIDVPSDFAIERDIDTNGDPMYEAYSLNRIPSKYITKIFDEYYQPIMENFGKAQGVRENADELIVF